MQLSVSFPDHLLLYWCKFILHSKDNTMSVEDWIFHFFSPDNFPLAVGDDVDQIPGRNNSESFAVGEKCDVVVLMNLWFPVMRSLSDLSCCMVCDVAMPCWTLEFVTY